MPNENKLGLLIHQVEDFSFKCERKEIKADGMVVGVDHITTISIKAQLPADQIGTLSKLQWCKPEWLRINLFSEQTIMGAVMDQVADEVNKGLTATSEVHHR